MGAKCSPVFLFIPLSPFPHSFQPSFIPSSLLTLPKMHIMKEKLHNVGNQDKKKIRVGKKYDHPENMSMWNWQVLWGEMCFSTLALPPTILGAYKHDLIWKKCFCRSNQVRMRSLAWRLIQYEGCPFKEENWTYKEDANDSNWKNNYKPRFATHHQSEETQERSLYCCVGNPTDTVRSDQ